MRLERLPNNDYRALGLRPGAILPDFVLEDAWLLPVDGQAGDYDALRALIGKLDRIPQRGVVGWLFRLRDFLGRSLGWDRAVNSLPIPGCIETSLADRLPPGERSTEPPSEGSLPFRIVYDGQRDRLLELSNATVHAALHIAWIERGAHHRAIMAVFVKYRGLVGRAYMAAITPFRRYIVYPTLFGRLGRAWQRRRDSGRLRHP